MPPTPDDTLISVALPVHRDEGTLPRAFACITAQTHANIEILLMLNGADAATTQSARALAAADSRARIIERPRANLAAALNVAAREAHGQFLARMDADDECPPQRLARQVQLLLQDANLAGVGSAFEIVDHTTGRILATARPPSDPAEVRWRLLTRNILCHGSMLLRRDALARVGGYDERLERAQDYDLWLRLSGLLPGSTPRTPCLACVDEVLYRYHVSPRATYASSSLQADAAAESMVHAWRHLPIGNDDDLPDLLAESMAHPTGAAEALSAIESGLRAEPTLSALTGWLWANWFFPGGPQRAHETCRRSRLREIGTRLRAQGVGALHLWGAGSHTAWLLSHLDDLGLPIAGLIDDALAGSDRFGFPVRSSAALQPGDVALLSSDWHEDAMWDQSQTARDRGARVVRLYAD